MSTDTSLVDDIGDETGFYQIDGKRILAQIVDMRHPSIQFGLDISEPIDGASLWGVLRSYPVDCVLLTVSDPIRVVVLFVEDEEPCGYYTISFEEYQKFWEFCDVPPVEVIDWRREGF